MAITTTEQKNTSTKAAPKLAKGRYIEAVGRRKTSIARVRITSASTGKNTFLVNGKDITEYFTTENSLFIAREAFAKVKLDGKFDVSAKVIGGGKSAQVNAVRLGISRALISYNEELRKRLKKSGLLKRDPRMKERKKFGKKKARKSPQWSKR